MDKTYNLFVYGTLQSSYGTSPFLNGLKHEKATCTGMMFNLSNRYPGCVFGRGATEIKGEVIFGVPEKVGEESTIEHLNRYEGATGKDDAMYVRKEIEVTLASGEKVKAFAYEVTEHTLGVMTHSEISGDWLGFITRPCPHLKKKITCQLTGCNCPYRGDQDYGRLAKTGCCALPAYADTHPEKDVPDSVLEPIAEFFDGCMGCDALSKHYYLSECVHFGCEGTYDQLRLKYLAKCYRDRHLEDQGKEGK